MKSTIRKLISALCLLTTLAAQTASGFYDPNLQRWLTLDPIGEAGGINLYQFVYNNPVDYLDPSGQFGTKRGFRIHQWAIDERLFFISKRSRNIIKEAQLTVDKDLSPVGAFKPALRGPKHDVCEAVT